MADPHGSVVGRREDGPEGDGALAEAGEVSDEGLLVTPAVTSQLRTTTAVRKKRLVDGICFERCLVTRSAWRCGVQTAVAASAPEFLYAYTVNANNFF